MNLRQLDLNLLAVFEAVHRERSLTRAAAELALTPSAVSHALARLRGPLGDPLFVRQGRGLVPTPAADRLAPQVREAFRLLEAALGARGSFDPRRDVARLAIAMPDELEPLLLPALLAAVRPEAPGLVVSSLRLDRRSLPADLASGRVDLAVDVAQAAGFDVRHGPLLTDVLCVVAARRRRALDAAGYLAASHVAVSSRRSGRVLEDFMLGQLGLERRVALRCQDYETACRIAAASDLLVTLPRLPAERHVAALRLRAFRFPVPLPPIEVHAYWHRGRDGDPALAWLRERLSAAVAVARTTA